MPYCVCAAPQPLVVLLCTRGRVLRRAAKMTTRSAGRGLVRLRVIEFGRSADFATGLIVHLRCSRAPDLLSADPFHISQPVRGAALRAGVKVGACVQVEAADRQLAANGAGAERAGVSAYDRWLLASCWRKNLSDISL